MDPTGVTGFSEVLIEYGWPGLIVIVVASIIILVLNYFLNKKEKKSTEIINDGFDKLTNTILGQNTKMIEAFAESNKENQHLLGEVIAKAIKDNDEKKIQDHRESMDRRLDANKGIKCTVHDVRNRYNADRAYILEFHNSKENINGLSFVWFDMVYEEIDKGVKSVQALVRDYDASLLAPVIKDLEDDGYVIYTEEDIKSFCDKSSVIARNLTDIVQVRESIVLAIHNHDNKLVALLVLEYENSGIPMNILNLVDLKEECGGISKLLEFK